jgi:hypothetical protein
MPALLASFDRLATNHANVTIWKRRGAVPLVFHIGSAPIDAVAAVWFGCTS